MCPSESSARSSSGRVQVPGESRWGSERCRARVLLEFRSSSAGGAVGLYEGCVGGMAVWRGSWLVCWWCFCDGRVPTSAENVALAQAWPGPPHEAGPAPGEPWPCPGTSCQPCPRDEPGPARPGRESPVLRNCASCRKVRRAQCNHSAARNVRPRALSQVCSLGCLASIAALAGCGRHCGRPVAARCLSLLHQGLAGWLRARGHRGRPAHCSLLLAASRCSANGWQAGCGHGGTAAGPLREGLTRRCPGHGPVPQCRPSAARASCRGRRRLWP